MRAALRRLVGHVAWLALPGTAKEVKTGTNVGRLPRLKAAMIEARLHSAVRKGAAGELQSVLAAGWRGAFGDRFHGAQAMARLQRTIDRHGAARRWSRFSGFCQMAGIPVSWNWGAAKVRPCTT